MRATSFAQASLQAAAASWTRTRGRRNMWRYVRAISRHSTGQPICYGHAKLFRLSVVFPLYPKETRIKSKA